MRVSYFNEKHSCDVNTVSILAPLFTRNIRQCTNLRKT